MTLRLFLAECWEGLRLVSPCFAPSSSSSSESINQACLSRGEAILLDEPTSWLSDANSSLSDTSPEAAVRLEAAGLRGPEFGSLVPRLVGDVDLCGLGLSQSSDTIKSRRSSPSSLSS